MIERSFCWSSWASQIQIGMQCTDLHHIWREHISITNAQQDQKDLVIYLIQFQNEVGMKSTLVESGGQISLFLATVKITRGVGEMSWYF